MKPKAAAFLAFVVAISWFTPAPEAQAAEIYPMVFPVAGPNTYSDTFGACRSGCSRSHQGIDIMAAKMTPVVAVADGTVGWQHTNPYGESRPCCAMSLRHDDGWESWYIHLNNDTPGTDDQQGWGFAPGIETGVHVEAGQLLGWVGDSGNAENSGSHLHFELHKPDGTVINPYESLLAAEYPELADSAVERLWGMDRYRTATDISQFAFPNGASTVFIATGQNFPDSLAGVPAAAMLNAPILLTPTYSLNSYTATELARLNPDHIIILGGTGAVSSGVESALQSYAPTITRLAGPTRFETAVEITKATFDPGIPVLYIVDGWDFPDAVISSPIAYHNGGAILLVKPWSIPTDVQAEIERLQPQSIVIVNGGSIGSSVRSQLAAQAPVTEISGADRYEIAANLSAAEITAPASVVYIAVGNNYPDALTGGVLASLDPGPVLLTETHSIPPSIAAELTRLQPARIVIFGGSGVVSLSVEAELAGYIVEP